MVFVVDVSQGFVQEVILDWALKQSAISQVERKEQGEAQKANSRSKAHKHRM